MKATPPPSSEPNPTTPPAVAPTPPAAPVTPTVPVVPTWPAWFGGADRLILGIVLIAAFLATSYAARNSDLWLHLATGRLVVTGSYPFGSDPFSYTGESRAWADSNWLYGTVLYGVYSANTSGAAAVIVKALAFTAAFVLVNLLRRPGHAVWPWAVFTAIGALAAAPASSLRPQMVSFLFLAITLVLIYRGRWGSGWRMPGILAGLFAVWANCDSWFLLGPLTVLLVLVGERIQRSITKSGSEVSDDTDPFYAAPSIPALTKALAIGVVACLLNPAFLAAVTKNPGEAVSQLIPIELGYALPPEAVDDADLVGLTLSPLSKDFTERGNLGYNINGFSAAAIFILGAFALGLGFARIRATHILLWVGFALVAMQQFRLIPFFVIVAIPLAAGHINGLSTRIRLGTGDSPGTRIILTLSGVGRILTLTAAVVMAAAAWPGWLHYEPVDRAVSHRVEWIIEPDVGLKRAAQSVQQYRESGELPSEVRGLNVSQEFGNYATWFAPGEKVFIDGRYRFHAAELSNLIRVRRAIGMIRSQTTARADPETVREVCDEYKAGYLTLVGTGRQTDLFAVFSLLDDGSHWKLWHLDGRAALVGRTGIPSTQKMGFNPVRLAYAAKQPPMPTVVPTPPAPTEKPFLEQYLDRPSPLSVYADDALVYANYTEIISNQASRQWQGLTMERMYARAASGSSTAVAISMLMFPPEAPAISDAQRAMPLLIVRAARRATAESPDRREEYLPLILAYQLPYTPVANADERDLQLTTAQVRYLERLPAPADCSPGMVGIAMTGFEQNASLSGNYQRTQQFDFARDRLRRAIDYAKRVAEFQPEAFRQFFPPNAKVEKPGEAVLKQLDAQLTGLTRDVSRRNDEFIRQSEQRSTPATRFQLAQALGLPSKAIEVFRDATDKKEQFGEDALPIAIEMILLELRAGLLEQATADLGDLNTGLQDAAGKGKTEDIVPVREQLRALQLQVDRLAGNYKAAGESLAESAAGQLPRFNPVGLKALQDALPLLTQVRPGVEVGLFATGGSIAFINFMDRVQPPTQIRQALLNEADFYFTRGLFALYEGDIAEAKTRFEQASRPQGFDLGLIGNPTRAQELATYLRLIRDAAAP